MFEEIADDDLWKNQEEWILKSWNFYKNYGVHTLTIEDGTEIYMLAERRFIQKQIDESGSHDGCKKDILEENEYGKEFSNPFMADSLPKAIWFSTHHALQ
nr:hypothetical protein [Tanacetum cinerariifolium]